MKLLFRFSTLTLMALFVLTFSSFRKKKDDLRLVRLRSVSKSYSHIIDFKYNDKGLVYEINRTDSSQSIFGRSGSVKPVKYEYDDKNRVIKEIQKFTYVTLTGTYSYNEDNTLARIDYTSSGKDPAYYALYKWNDGKLMDISYKMADGSFFYQITGAYSDNGEIDHIVGGNSDTAIKPLYNKIMVDDEKGYITAIKGLINPYIIFNTSPHIFSKHNIISYDEIILNEHNSYHSDIEYNKKGYPVKEVKNDKENTIIYYEYNK